MTLVIHEHDKISPVDGRVCAMCGRTIYVVERVDETNTAQKYVWTICACGLRKYRKIVDALTGQVSVVEIRHRNRKS